MDPIAEDLLDVVRPELGYREKDDQYTKFGAWYAANIDPAPQFKTAPWCDMFIAWAANRAGVENFVGEYAYTPAHAVWFKRQGAWSDRPEPGALVFYDWSGSKDTDGIDHVGLVEKVEGGKIHTIEANVDKVWLKRKVRDESKVVGYGLPRKVKSSTVPVSRFPAAMPTPDKVL
ncbi:CHAP domain-containing protein [Streptosporangium sp. NPDC002544]|uniref:CHAP domain-containing protein n=1 Tax=Streptosporangium sp. NPDC002544 TaxID=3154538 RepID=UPI00332B04B3